MGSWGEGPTDNDTAADLADDLKTRTMYEVIMEGLGSKDIDEQRCVAWLISRMGKPYIRDSKTLLAHVKLALSQMKELLANDEWIDTWNNKSIIREVVQKQIDDLTDLLSEPKPE